jgi:hypothetical protein
MSPLIGMADNGDYYRIMLPNGLKHEQEWEEDDFFGYFNHKYDILQYYNETGGDIRSTQSIIINIALALDNIFTKDIKFDIRFLAIISLSVLALALYWLVEFAEKMVLNKYLKYFLALLALIIFGDIGYIAYFNSFYGEAVAYPFFLLSVSALLKFSIDSEHGKRYLFIYFISSIIFMGSKNQLSLNGILSFSLLGLLIFLKIENGKKILAVSLGILLLSLSIFMYFLIDDNIYLINKYHMMTRGVMLHEPDLETVTEEIGLNKQFSLLAETVYFDRTPVIDPKDQLLLEDFYSRYDVISVALYYLKNPGAFSKLLRFGLKNSFTVRPEVIGNYERSVGFEYGYKTNFFSFWSNFKENHVPHSANFVYFFLLICLLLSINRLIEYRKKDPAGIYFYSEFVLLFVVLTGFSQVLVSFVGAGDADLKKHLFITTVSLDILFYYNLVYLVSFLVSKLERTGNIER